MFVITISVYSFLLIFIPCVYLCSLKRKDSSTVLYCCCVNTMWGAWINRRSPEQRYSVEVFAFWSGTVSDCRYQNYGQFLLRMQWKNISSIFMLWTKYFFGSQLFWYIRLTWFWEGQRKFSRLLIAVDFFFWLSINKQYKFPSINDTRKLL